MDENYQNPTWTRFICTLGPSSATPEVLEQLIRSGANILRNNFAHCQYDEYRARKATIEEINQRLGTQVQIQADLQGPNLRVGPLVPEGVMLEAGHEYTFYTSAAPKPGPDERLLINDPSVHEDVKPGEPISFMDGALEAEIVKVEGPYITIRMINGGRLFPKKSLNLPASNLTTPAITEKDRRDLDFLLDAGVDWLALSFVGGRKEIDEVRALIGDRPIKIITKVERRAAIENILDIIDASDAIMIARGDLGIELPFEEVPILQRRITALCEIMGKPVITATQMLLSMAEHPRPTRAEVSDVANAVFGRSDALMLSEETANGKYPKESIETMVRVARRVEEYLYSRPNFFI